jgi:hypothetical protein
VAAQVDAFDADANGFVVLAERLDVADERPDGDVRRGHPQRRRVQRVPGLPQLDLEKPVEHRRERVVVDDETVLAVPLVVDGEDGDEAVDQRDEGHRRLTLADLGGDVGKQVGQVAGRPGVRVVGHRESDGHAPVLGGPERPADLEDLVGRGTYLDDVVGGLDLGDGRLERGRVGLEDTDVGALEAGTLPAVLQPLGGRLQVRRPSPQLRDDRFDVGQAGAHGVLFVRLDVPLVGQVPEHVVEPRPRDRTHLPEFRHRGVAQPQQAQICLGLVLGKARVPERRFQFGQVVHTTR